MRFFPNVKYVNIRYKSLKILLSDIIARLRDLLFSEPVALLSLPCTIVTACHK